MTWADFDPWSRRSVRGFAAQQVAAGLGSEAEATAYAEDFFATVLPEGLATPTHAFWNVREGDGPAVGHLWLRIRPTREDEVEAFVLDVEIDPAQRGRGLGHATMRAAETRAGDLGATVMRLNVFGHNTPAVGLYASLGYTAEDVTVTRRLGLTPAPAVTRPVVLVDMTEQEYDAARAVLDEAAEGRLRQRLPQGPATSGHRLWTVWDDATAVARVWLHLLPRADGVNARVRLLEVADELRGQGYGRATVAAVERACRDLGVLSLSATVGAAVVPALRLAAGSGSSLTAQTMAKPLWTDPGCT